MLWKSSKSWSGTGVALIVFATGCDPDMTSEEQQLAFEEVILRATPNELASGIPVVEGTRWCPAITHAREVGDDWPDASEPERFAGCFQLSATGSATIGADGCATFGVGEGAVEFAQSDLCELDTALSLVDDRYVMEGRAVDGLSVRWRDYAERSGLGAWSGAAAEWLLPTTDVIKVVASTPMVLVVDIYDAQREAIGVHLEDVDIHPVSGAPLTDPLLIDGESRLVFTSPAAGSQPTRLASTLGGRELSFPAIEAIAPADVASLEVVEYEAEDFPALAAYGLDVDGAVVFGVPVEVEVPEPYLVENLMDDQGSGPMASPLWISDGCFEPDVTPREHQVDVTLRFGAHEVVRTMAWTQDASDGSSWAADDNCSSVVRVEGGCFCSSDDRGPGGAAALALLVLLAVRRRPSVARA